MLRKPMLFIIAGLALMLVACGHQQTDSPVGVVESYNTGRVASDSTLLVSLSCKDQESQAQTDADSFKSMKATIDSMSCNQAGTDGSFTIVACQGKVLTTYAGESRTWNLGDRNFKTIQEDGKWKVCGTTSASK